MTEYTIPDTYTVLDLVTQALLAAGIDFVNEGGNYISSINGLGEFDNGNLSGWMYTLNGTHPGLGVAEQTLVNGDYVILHYSDDYTVEEGSEPWYPENGGGTGGNKGEEPFTDGAETDFFFDAVKWAVEKGITKGTSDTTFSPDASCTRAQMVTFLWRAAGEPKATATTCVFTDVDKDAYYYEALLWAVENGITSGTSETTFSPDAECTRGQMAAFLYRSVKSPAVSGNHSFGDVAADAYYNDAVIWAAAQGITKGTTDTTFSPDADCTRGQMVTFLYRCFAE